LTGEEITVGANCKASLRAGHPNRTRSRPSIRSGDVDQDGGEKKEAQIPFKKIDSKRLLLDALDRALKAAMANVDEIGSFDVIGFTEKELGRSMIDRMVAIANLRLAMNAADVKIPIHVFGSLDPLSICLYFLSGAEIFDGLTWIRYAFHKGQCLYFHNFGVLRYGLYTTDNLIKSRAISENYFQLQELQHRLQEFHSTKNFEKLEPHAKTLEDAWDSLKTRLKGKV
jgi:hypothetical protein